MNNPWWTMKDQMDDRKRFLLKKIKRWEKWSRHLNNESDSRIQKVTTSRYEESFLSGKNEKVESPPKQETNRRDATDMAKNKAIKDPNDNPKGWICQLKMRDEKDDKVNVDETPGTEKLCPRQRCQKCWRCRARWRDKKWEKWFVVWNTEKTISPATVPKNVGVAGSNEW